MNIVQERLAGYADLARWAPSKHNAQPWTFVVRREALELWVDADRGLPETDPSGRESFVALGAALQLACLAMRAGGHEPGVQLLPDGPDGPVARLTEHGPRSVTELDLALAAAIPLRRTDRGPLDAGALPASLPFELQAAATQHGAVLRLVSTAGDRSTLARLVERADRLLVTAGGADRELAPWLRGPGDPRGDGVPSASTRGATASYRAEFVQRDFSQQGSVPAHDRPGRDAPLVGVLCTSHDEVRDWLTAGRALAQVLLTAHLAGAQASYLDQPVEVPELRVQLTDQLRLTGPPQLVLRIGAGGLVLPPPRRDDVVLRT